MALCDLGLDAFAICGIATEVGIEPTVRHGADLGYTPSWWQTRVVRGRKRRGGERWRAWPSPAILS